MLPIRRCRWCNPRNPLYIAYHDSEWGVPCHDDHALFELLILEGFQAGLSWECVLNKREAFRAAFDQFDWEKVAAYGEDKVAALLADSRIIRNRLKVHAAIRNAAIFRGIREEHGSFDAYLTTFTGGEIRIEHDKTTNDLSDRISRDLRRRGMRFVGSTIIYAYLQAIGAINSHEPGCALFPGAQPMKCIAYLTDQTVLGMPGLSSATPRITARAIVMSPDNHCAVMYAAKFNIHTLPGGGVEEGESIEEALLREITEETGCTIKSYEPLGYVAENRAHADYTQISYYYIVHTQDETLHPRLTALETENGTRVFWCTLDEARERISTPVFDRPQGKFLQARDMAALTAYFARNS